MEEKTKNTEQETQWCDDDGEFILADGSWGNPGCDCGMYDAVVRIGKGRQYEYLCAAEAEERGVQKPVEETEPYAVGEIVDLSPAHIEVGHARVEETNVEGNPNLVRFKIDNVVTLVLDIRRLAQ